MLATIIIQSAGMICPHNIKQSSARKGKAQHGTQATRAPAPEQDKATQSLAPPYGSVCCTCAQRPGAATRAERRRREY